MNFDLILAIKYLSYGSEQFKTEMLEEMETHLGENHAGELKNQIAEAKAERIIAEELRRLGWTPSDLKLRTKSDPAKLQMASRLRAETTLSVSWIAERLHLGTRKSASSRIHTWRKSQNEKTSSNAMGDPGPFQHY